MWKRELDSCLGAKAISAERSCRKVTGPPTTLVSPPTLGLVHDQFMTESQSLKDGIQLWLSQMHGLQLSQFLRNSWLIIICAQARRPRRSYGSRCVRQLKPRYEGLSVHLKNAFNYDSFCYEIVSIAGLSDRFQIHHENINTKAAVAQRYVYVCILLSIEGMFENFITF